MTTLPNSHYCYCCRTFKYPGVYQRHLASQHSEHLRVFQAETQDSLQLAGEYPDSDYESSEEGQDSEKASNLPLEADDSDYDSGDENNAIPGRESQNSPTVIIPFPTAGESLGDAEDAE